MLRARRCQSVGKPADAIRRPLLEGLIVSTLLWLTVPNVLVSVILIAVTASINAYFVGQLDRSALAGLSLRGRDQRRSGEPGLERVPRMRRCVERSGKVLGRRAAGFGAAKAHAWINPV